MNAKERLHALQAELTERGVKDVKFYFSRPEAQLSQVATDVADALEAYINGNYSPLEKLGD